MNWKDMYVSGAYKFSRGMSFIDRIKQVVALPVYIGMANLTILNPLGYNIPAQYMIFLIPGVLFGALAVGYLDQHYLHIWQREQEYGPRNLNPWSQELMKLVKNIDRRTEIK